MRKEDTGQEMAARRHMSGILALTLGLALIPGLAGCSAGASSGGSSVGTSPGGTSAGSAASGELPSATRDIFAMDTYMSVTAYGDRCEEACQAALEEITRVDGLLSVGKADSEIGSLNAAGSGIISGETLEMLQVARTVYNTTDGAFDVTIYPLMDLWGFTGEVQQVPAEEEILRCLGDMGMEKLQIAPVYPEDSGEDAGETAESCAAGESTAAAGTPGETAAQPCTGEIRLTLGENQGIDLGGIAKGYTSGRIMEIFRDYGLVSGLVSLGGNVHAFGTKPDGSLWRIGIRDPHHPGESAMLGVLEVADQCVITSGAYERNFTDRATGKVYHHILDPADGYPAEAGLLSATVVSSDGTLADTLSTACYVMGADRSLDYWRQHGEDWDFDLILMTDEDRVYVTEGLADLFTSDYPVETVQRS